MAVIPKFATSIKDVENAIEEFTDSPDFEEVLDLAEADQELCIQLSAAARHFNDLLEEAKCNYQDEVDEQSNDEEEADDE